MKSLLEYINESITVTKFNDILNKSMNEEKRWDEIKKIDFEDLGISSKGKNGLELDLRLDGFHNYECSNHLPCVYFRVGNEEYDFLPMIISESPYIPYSFEQTIDDDKLLWIYSWVKCNKNSLLKYANEEIGYKSLFAMVAENANTLANIIEEGKTKINKQDSGLTRTVWIGPYAQTPHYLRIKIQTPKSSNNTNDWVSLSIPDLKLTGQNDLKPKEIENVGKFALLNQDALNKFANDEIDLDTLLKSLIKVDKKGVPSKSDKENEDN